MKNATIALLVLLTAGSARLSAQGGNAGVQVDSSQGSLCVQDGSPSAYCQPLTWTVPLQAQGTGGGFAAFAPGFLAASAVDTVSCISDNGCNGSTLTYAASNFSDSLTFLNLQPGVTYNLKGVLEMFGAIDGGFITATPIETVASTAYLGSDATNCNIIIQTNTSGGSITRSCSVQIPITYDSQVSIGGSLQVSASAELDATTNANQEVEMIFAGPGLGSQYCYVVLDANGRVDKGAVIIAASGRNYQDTSCAHIMSPAVHFRKTAQPEEER